MTRDEAVAAIAAHADLVERFIEILRDPPYWTLVENKECARVTIAGNQATLRWPIVGGYGDDCELDNEVYNINTNLLLMPEMEFVVWKSDQAAIY